MGKCIYTSPSGYKVYQNPFYRWLTLGSNALQTVISRSNPQKPILHYLPALTLMAQALPDKCCLLGLGGAGAVHLLSSSPSITAVDVSNEVIHIAQQYFMLDSIPNLALVYQNAMNYVQECDTHYPHLIIDLYGANFFPSECNNEPFFLNCKRILAKDGFVAINLANLKEQWPIFELVKNQFKNTMVLPIKKSANMVIIASEHHDKSFFINKLTETGKIKNIALVHSWGFVGEYNNG